MGVLGVLKSLLSAQKGFRWSLYFVHKDEGLRYALHENAVFVLLGYVAAQCERDRKIHSDWQVVANFNWAKKHIRLHEADFPMGDVSDNLVERIQAIDKGFMVPGGKPVFVDARSGKVLPLGASYEAIFQSQEERLDVISEMLVGNSDRSSLNLSSVLGTVFVK